MECDWSVLSVLALQQAGNLCRVYPAPHTKTEEESGWMVLFSEIEILTVLFCNVLGLLMNSTSPPLKILNIKYISKEKSQLPVDTLG